MSGQSIYLFHHRKKRMKRREYRKNTDAKWCGSSKGKTRQDKTRQDIVTLQVQLFGTQLARKRQSRRAKLILLQNRYYIIISKKQRKRKEEISVMNSKARKTNLFNATCERGLRFRISRFYFLCYHGCIKVIIPLIDIGLPQSKKVYVYKARFEYKCIKKYSNK